MIAILWAGMIILGVIIGICTGQGAAVGEAAISSSREAVTLCITMLGVMTLWTGIMQIARDSGLIAGMSKGMRPVMRLLFPDLPEEHPATEYIISNMIANILGLGWAATPLGLSAMRELAKWEEEKAGRANTYGTDIESKNKNQNPRKTGGRASVDMCTFLIINISYLQLIPINIIAYRTQYGAVRPTDIVGAAILATFCSTLAGVLFSIIARKLATKREAAYQSSRQNATSFGKGVRR